MNIKLQINIYVNRIIKLRLTRYPCLDTVPIQFPFDYQKTVDVDKHMTQEQYDQFERDLISDVKIKSFGWTVEKL
jgi:hypothetical protein